MIGQFTFIPLTVVCGLLSDSSLKQFTFMQPQISNRVTLASVIRLLMPVVALSAVQATFAQVNYSQRLTSSEVPWVTSQATGLVRWERSTSISRGSGAVARDSRLVYTCAHVIYSGSYASPNQIRFYRAHNASTGPVSGGISPRSYRYFSNYATTRSTSGVSASATYNLDLVILVGYSAFGNAQPYYAGNGGAATAGTQWKYIGGYPATIDYTGLSGGSFQHRTPFFTNQGALRQGRYYGFTNVSTGPGNSGGPVWIYSSTSKTWGLAAVLVSGSSSTAGVCALDSSAETMGQNAVADTIR